jgi:hypothetical protein
MRSLASFFVLYSILFLPFPFSLTHVQQDTTGFLFGWLIRITARLFGTGSIEEEIHSDSPSIYILLLLLFLFSVLSVVLLQFIKKWPAIQPRFIRIVERIGCYYLVLILLKYGVDKLFKNQFYIPEPNTLFTPFGMLEKDLLYWSTMGTSHFYNVFLAILEILSALLLIFRKTRLAGLVLALGLLLNIAAVNFGFDISVKLYSLFLLFLCLYLLLPWLNRLYRFFFTGSAVPAHVEKTGKRGFLYSFLEIFILGLIILEVFYPFVRAGTMNRDKLPRPFLYGAYEIKLVVVDNDSLPLVYSPVRRFFIHSKGYMIFQDREDRMQDYKLGIEKDSSAFILTDYQLRKTRVAFTYQPADSLLVLHYTIEGKEYRLTGKAIDGQSLPALRKGFRWTE